MDFLIFLYYVELQFVSVHVLNHKVIAVNNANGGSNMKSAVQIIKGS